MGSQRCDHFVQGMDEWIPRNWHCQNYNGFSICSHYWGSLVGTGVGDWWRWGWWQVGGGVCVCAGVSGPCLIIMMVFPGMGIPMLKIRRSWDHLIFNMGIPMLIRQHLYIETTPDWLLVRSCVYVQCLQALLTEIHKVTSHRWVSARKTQLQCISNGVTFFLH